MSGQVTGPPSAATRPMEHVRVGQVRALGHEHDVGEGDETAAQADGGAVHRGHDGHATAHHAGDDPTAVGQRLLAGDPGVPGQLVEIGEVAAGRERLPVPGQDDRPGLVVGIDLREEAGQALVQLVVGGVELLGPVGA